MRSWYVDIVGAALAACILLPTRSDGVSPVSPASSSSAASSVRAVARQVETDRIVRQLAAVAEAMRAAPPAHLSAAQQHARGETLRWLDEYRRREVFPHNHILMGRRTPVFVDPHGTPCAVAYLLLRSGETELVEDVVRSANLARVRELAADARLQAWLARRGITAAEAARIQPEYGGAVEDSGVSGYVGATVGFSLLTAALGSYSLMASKPTRRLNAPRVLGVASLLGHAALVAVAVGGEEDRSPLALLANIVGGVVSGVLVAGPFAPTAGAPMANVGSFAVTARAGFDARGMTMGVTIRPGGLAAAH